MSVPTSDHSPSATAMAGAQRPRVLISILNWNGLQKTLTCLESLQDQRASTPADVTTLVIDNGSHNDEAAALSTALASTDVVLRCLPHNLGFTGGHNVAIKMVIEEGYDFIWLLNNDAKVTPGTLRELVLELSGHERCGAVSPILRDIDDGTVARCVNTHDWDKRCSRRILDLEEARRFQEQHPLDCWVDGTAVLFRVSALKEVGPLDDRLFAYYDDNEIGVRLAARGWSSRCVFTATVLHENRKKLEEYPMYLNYLLQRNELLFYYANTPPRHRGLLWLRLMDKAWFDASRFHQYGLEGHSKAAMLGIYDFMKGNFGPPAHDRPVPASMYALRAAAGLFYNLKNTPMRLKKRLAAR